MRKVALPLLLFGLVSLPAALAWCQNEKPATEKPATEKPNKAENELLPTCIEGIDEGFSSYVNLDLIGRGFQDLNSAMMTDAVLQLAEGERVLLRKHRAIDSDELAKITLKLAAENNDTESLARLAKFAETRGDAKLAERIAATQKMAGASRSSVQKVPVDLGRMTPDSVARYRDLGDLLRRAKLLGDLRMIEAIESILEQIDSSPELRDSLLKDVLRDKKLMMASRGDSESTTSKSTKEAVAKLASSSRGTNFFSGGQLTQQDRNNIWDAVKTFSGNANNSGGPNTGNWGPNSGNRGPNTGNFGPNTGNRGPNTGNRGPNTGTPGWNNGSGWPTTGGAIPVDPWGRPIPQVVTPQVVTYTQKGLQDRNGQEVLWFHGSDGNEYYQCNPTCSKMHNW